MVTKKSIKFFLFCLTFLLSSTLVLAQAGRGRARIGGTVLDESGAPIQGAKITVIFQQDKSIKRDAQTNKKGEWGIISLGSGNWRVLVSADGFEAAQRVVDVRQLDRNPPVDFTLKKGIEISPLIQDEASLAVLDEGNKLFNEQDYDGAIRVYKEFLLKNPKAFQVHLSIGDGYNKKGDLDAAINEFDILLETAETDPDFPKEVLAKALAGKGEAFLKKGEVEEAQNLFKQSIETYSGNEVLAYNVGEIYFGNQKLDEALEYFSLAAEINEDYAPAYLKLGYVYLNKNEQGLAKENFNRFLSLTPDAPEAATVKSILDYLN